MTRKTPAETRARLIQAAIDILVEKGAAYLTLDAVAHTARVSKGGLLHHFPTKEALLHGIDDQATQLWTERLASELAQEPEGRAGRWSRAYIRATFDPLPEEARILQALTRIIGVYPDLIQRWRSTYAQTSASLIDDGLPPGRSATIQVACDGMWLGEMVGLPLISDSQRAAVRADLLRLTYDV
ncbi:MAG: TetR/AcrR family transcriptional regulator [Chloroflexi bacterium]|nr:TetR family transcriptional regulator [Anaerolineaceae bacterium]NMB88200.1 TetR/AcrR family transcriptional regulator [Chloroflexota bacterium]